MKRKMTILLTAMLITTIIFVAKYKDYEINQIDIKNFNLIYEEYQKDNLNGLDITTVMNKATSNNEKKEIPKDENGLYILDDEYSIEIYISMITTDDTYKTYKMERFNQVGINDFIRYFGEVSFKCTDVTYHKKTGRIATMTFEAKEY